MQKYVLIHEKDNVAVALQPLSAGEQMEFELCEDIPAGHKFALREIGEGEDIIKYGSPIGVATVDIPPGSHVHTKNMKTKLGDIIEYSYQPVDIEKVPMKESHFHGFRRKDGKVGIRNQIWIIPTVGCVNSIAGTLAKIGSSYLYGSVDEVIAFPHPYGCSQLGDDQENTMKIIAGLIGHPNAAGVLVVGLGCENCNIDVLEPYLGQYDRDRVRFIRCQQAEDELAEGEQQIKELIEYGNQFKRETISAAELIIGLKCGGSDGLSGITANPLVGSFSDRLIGAGGTTILTEVPEMFGAETILMNRCSNEELFGKTVNMINSFKNYYKEHNQPIYENPSPGNKEGGISTLEDKSLGCTQKSGNAPITDVLEYGEQVKVRGLNLLSAPGNDLVASTALAAAGAHMVLFTTGRGTPFGCPVPTMKISSNTQLSRKKSNWIDFNAGRLAEGYSKEEIVTEFFDFVLATASGDKLKSEQAGFYDMAIFKTGVTL